MSNVTGLQDRIENVGFPPSVLTIESIAGYLETGVAASRDPGSELHNAIPTDVRERYGFGDLPDRLIRAVMLEVAHITPDHLGGDATILKLAAQTMRVIQASPDTNPDSLRMQLDPEAAGIKPGSIMSLTHLAVYSGAITIAEYLAEQHFNQPANPIGE
jgi:hypothetical protein